MQDLVIFVAQKHDNQLQGIYEFLREQGIAAAPFFGYLAAQILPESFESLRLLASEHGVFFPSNCQDGVHRPLTHPGITVEATLQFSYHEPTPAYLYTSFTSLERLCTYTGGRRYRTVTVQDASSQHHYTALWFDVPRAYAEDLLAKGPHQVDINGSGGTLRWPQWLTNDSGNLMALSLGHCGTHRINVQALLLESPCQVRALPCSAEGIQESLCKCTSLTQKCAGHDAHCTISSLTS